MNTENHYSIGFQGVPGAFSEAALTAHFGDNITKKPYSDFEDVFKALEKGEITYAVLPFENSSTGSIFAIYDLILKYSFYIKSEQYIKIRQCLVAMQGANVDDISELYSHPQGIAQCSEFLKNYPKWKLIPFYNTATSAKFIAENGDKSKAAIASEDAARLYGLSVLKKDINDNKNNTTRFVILSKEYIPNKKADKISIVFSLENKSGNLYSLLGAFSQNNINLIKIESRPIKGEKWKYLLYLDFEGNVQAENVKSAIELIKRESEYFQILGSYEKSEDI